MPKEQINYPRIRQVLQDGASITLPVASEVSDDVCVSVGWNRSGWVQVTLETPTKHLAQVLASYANDNVGDAVVYSETLSREEVNKLIRTLRKARDQAYGSDA